MDSTLFIIAHRPPNTVVDQNTIVACTLMLGLVGCLFAKTTRPVASHLAVLVAGVGLIWSVSSFDFYAAADHLTLWIYMLGGFGFGLNLTRHHRRWALGLGLASTIGQGETMVYTVMGGFWGGQNDPDTGGITMAVSMVIIGFMLCVAIALLRRHYPWSMPPKRGECPRCHYDLRGS